MKQSIDFLELHKEGLEHIGFWEEGYIKILKKSVEQNYKTNIIRDYTITDIVLKGTDKYIVKWVKRFQPLTDKELEEEYGRKINKI